MYYDDDDRDEKIKEEAEEKLKKKIKVLTKGIKSLVNRVKRA